MTTNAITTTAPGWSAALTPQTTDEAWKIATAIAKSSLVPRQYQGQPGDIIIAASMGARLGLDPFSAMQGIAVVNGRPTLWGDAMLAVCQARPDWRGQTVTWTGEGDKMACTVTVRRQIGDVVDEYPGTFGVEDAKKAGLWTKQGPWSQYPRRMLELRARAFALRGAFADALLGFHAREEMEDVQPVEGTVVGTETARGPGRRRVVQPSIGAPTVVDPLDLSAAEQAQLEVNAEIEAKGAEAASAPTPAEPAGEPAPALPSEEFVRSQVNAAAMSAAGGAKAVVAEISRVLGYTVNKAADIKPEDRQKAIAAARQVAGLE